MAAARIADIPFDALSSALRVGSRVLLIEIEGYVYPRPISERAVTPHGFGIVDLTRHNAASRGIRRGILSRLAASTPEGGAPLTGVRRLP